jgi:hypothetical protein
MHRRRSAAWATGAAIAVALTACGEGGSTAASRVQIGEVRSALAAVEAQLGGIQTYSEVNATETEVNVFVVTGGQDFAYVVVKGKVDAPSAGEPYGGRTFVAKQVAFEPNVLDLVVEQLPDSDVAAFSITPNPSGGVDYIATVRARGSELRVLLDTSGKVISTG